MAGSTATICVQAFRRQWNDGVPMAVLCANWTITKDQLIRLKCLWRLPLRHDRSRPRPDSEYVPPDEIAASERSLSLAPAIAVAAAAIRTGWSLEVEHARRGTQSGGPASNGGRVVSLSALQSAVQEHHDSE